MILYPLLEIIILPQIQNVQEEQSF